MSSNPFRRQLDAIKAGQARRASDPTPAAEAAAVVQFFEPLYDLVDQMHLAGIRFEAGAIKSAAAFRRSNVASGIRPVIHVQMDSRRDLLIQVVDEGRSLQYDCAVRELASVASHVRTGVIAEVEQWLTNVIADDYARRSGRAPEAQSVRRFRRDDARGRGAVERRPDLPVTDGLGTTFNNPPGIGAEDYDPEEPDVPTSPPVPEPPARPFRSIDLNEET